MPSPDYLARQNDHGQVIEGVLTDEDGAAVSISAATIGFTMAPLTGGAAVLSAEAANDQDDSDPTTIGHVSYEWQAADLATPGHYLAEWSVTFADNSRVTFPNNGYINVLITEDLAPDYE